MDNIYSHKSNDLLTKMIIDAEIKLLNEGILDFFLDKNDSSVRKRQAVNKMNTDQKNKERQRLYYINKGLPIPASFHKEKLRKYYKKNKLAVPKHLQGAEDEDTDPRGEEAGVNNLISFFAKKLNMHPGQEKKIKSGLESAGGGIATAGSFLAGLYKKSTGNDFFPGGKVPPVEELTAIASDESNLKDLGDDMITSYTSSKIAGFPGKHKMFYLFISNLENFMYSSGQENTGDIEADAMAFIKGYVEEDVFVNGASNVIEEKFAMKKRIHWEKIAKFIKTETSNDKTDLKAFKCGHYFVDKSGGKLQLKPIGLIPNIIEGELK
jgi:hypothetical protein